MRRAVNLTGQRFGKLIVLSQGVELFQGRKQGVCHCRCDCGNDYTVPVSKLANKMGNPKPGLRSCGCGKRIADITGKQFGKLTVVRQTGNKNENGEYLWLCRCECGNEKEVSGSQLKSGFVKSCGCLVEKRINRLADISKESAKASHLPEAEKKRAETLWTDENRERRGKALEQDLENTFARKDHVNAAVIINDKPQGENPYRGVFWNKRKQRWTAFCQVAGYRWQANFKTLKEAKEARDKKQAEMIEQYGIEELIKNRREYERRKG